MHLALVKIRASHSINDEAIKGVARSLSGLAKLGMLSVIVVDQDDGQSTEGRLLSQSFNTQANRIVEIIQTFAQYRAQVIEPIISVSNIGSDACSAVACGIQIENQNWLYSYLIRGVIPVIPSVGVLREPSHRIVKVEANQALLALTRELTGIQAHQRLQTGDGGASSNTKALQGRISLERIILLDPLGGIPSAEPDRGSHVYINVEQEYQSIRASLRDLSLKGIPSNDTMIHMQNLDLLKDVLSLLPPSSSGFITTPYEVARSENHPPEHSTGPRVRTRRQRNPLIHNLLTDKPAISSSLPFARSPHLTRGVLCSTFLKRGMPVTIIPNPNTSPWIPPRLSSAPFTLTDPRIHLTRLIHLIEASFQRKLNVNHYLTRLQNRTVGLVVAGEYDGCALFTWETPPGSSNLMVPYLDKFAVLPQWQGTGVGVADILFKAMVKDCFPKGFCWRSRANNSVNKWYFERAEGTRKIPGTKWTSFWTKENASADDLKAYEDVCKAVEPSWED
ncbi:MAG: hypothetical protein Q9163_002226 [Psora crenata]